MNLIPSLLKMGNFKISKKSFDGNFPKQSGAFCGKDMDYLDLYFPAPTTINMITLFEKGENVTDFEIYYEKDGAFERIYKQNRIADFRLCALPEVCTKTIRIKVLKTRKGFFKEIYASAYCLPPKPVQFRTTAYIVLDAYKKIDTENLRDYNKFNLIGGIQMNDCGEVSFDAENFNGALQMLRTHDENADIVATLMSEGSMVSVLKNPKTPENIKKFLDTYALNGVSFDWEFPKNLYEWLVFDRFIVRLKEVIGKKSITLALPSWMRYRFSKKALSCIDVAEVMTYDNMPRDVDGHHSEFFSDGPNAMYHFVQIGFSLAQLDLGLPYYARPVNGTGYWSDYRTEVDKLDWFTNVAHDEYRDLDWKQKEILVKPRFYNCCQMIEDKTAFCIYAGVGGVMVWALNSDTPADHPLCLSKVLTKTLSERAKR